MTKGEELPPLTGAAAFQSQQEDCNELNDKFEWIEQELQKLPVSSLYPTLAQNALDILKVWRQRFPKQIWIRIFRRDRVLKELNETAPVMDYILKAVKNYSKQHDKDQITIVDLCCGFGYMSMFLAEMLDPQKVNRLVLIDKQWPHHEQEQALPHQISDEHIRNFQWPIFLQTRKVGSVGAS